MNGNEKCDHAVAATADDAVDAADDDGDADDADGQHDPYVSAMLRIRHKNPSRESLASLDKPRDASEREGRIFLPTPHTHDRFFFLHTFNVWP